MSHETKQEPAILDDLHTIYRRAEIDRWPYHGGLPEKRARLMAHLDHLTALAQAIQGTEPIFAQLRTEETKRLDEVRLTSGCVIELLKLDAAIHALLGRET